MNYRNYLERQISFLRFEQTCDRKSDEELEDLEMEIQQLEEELEDLEMEIQQLEEELENS